MEVETKSMSLPEEKLSPVEAEKANSQNLRGTLKEQLAEDTSHFQTTPNLLKFHGIYQQDNRDTRQSRLKDKKDKEYIFMVRTKLPGGKTTAQQYLKMDELAGQFGNQTMRITTRQGIQFHGVIKKNLKRTMKSINEALITTLGACGDIVRNVVCCPAPLKNRQVIELQKITHSISDYLLPRTNAYHEIWLNGEKTISSEEEIEPLYGNTYLPRKFKIAFAFPGDNCIDIYTHDLGFIPVIENEHIRGFNVLAGGGMGMTHNIANTYPLMAKPLGYVAKDKVRETAEAVIKVQRDHGNRKDRKRARLKYLIEERGLDWFKGEVAKMAGFRLEPFREVDWQQTEDHLGWHENGTGKYFYGIFVENGRIKNDGNLKLRAGLKKLVETFKTDVYFTTNQNILLDGIDGSRKAEVEKILKDHGIPTDQQISNMLRWSMACPAMPTCGLAITESERALPQMMDQLEQEISRLGLQEEKITLRMTGCPNGCARPYTSEIGIVGNVVGGFYALFFGGNFEGTRLNQQMLGKVPQDKVVEVLVSILEVFKQERQGKERFGDFCHRIGAERIKKISSFPLPLGEG